LAQVPEAHVVPDAVQTLLAQQGWPTPPQATHAFAEQRVPPAQMLPQQGWPSAPQAVQVPAPVQVAPVLQLVPQQRWLFPPQAVQVPLEAEQR
jgi:hypothetical protein